LIKFSGKEKKEARSAFFSTDDGKKERKRKQTPRQPRGKKEKNVVTRGRRRDFSL